MGSIGFYVSHREYCCANATLLLRLNLYTVVYIAFLAFDQGFTIYEASIMSCPAAKIAYASGIPEAESWIFGVGRNFLYA